MISELVDGSACTKPPVDGPADAVTGAVACGDAPLVVVPAVASWLVGLAGVVDEPPLAPLPLGLYAARSTAASFVASAFFR
jgi:hypothetical protein